MFRLAMQELGVLTLLVLALVAALIALSRSGPSLEGEDHAMS